MLRLGGQLYVATKNRYALLHFLGQKPDNGTQIRWLGILPTRLQSLLSLKRCADSGARLHGLAAYRRIFRAVGFLENEAYAVLPTLQRPKCFIPLTRIGHPGILPSQETGSRRLESLVLRYLPGWLAARLVYCYAFLLEKA